MTIMCRMRAGQASSLPILVGPPILTTTRSSSPTLSSLVFFFRSRHNQHRGWTTPLEAMMHPLISIRVPSGPGVVMGSGPPRGPYGRYGGVHTMVVGRGSPVSVRWVRTGSSPLSSLGPPRGPSGHLLWAVLAGTSAALWH